MKAVVTQYYPAASPLHGLDPRAKIVATIALGVALFFGDSWIALAVFGVTAAVGVALSTVPPVWFWRAMRPVLWLVALTFVAQMVFYQGGGGWEVGPFTISGRGAALAAFLSVRLLVLVVIGALLTLTTPPIGLTDGLAWLGRPLRRLRVPTEEIALMMTVALRFIPSLLLETETIMRAQKARGADFTSGGPLRRARALVPVLVPLFVLSFRRADELALAMEARCYRPGIVRSRLHPMRARTRDWATLALVAGIITLGLAV